MRADARRTDRHTSQQRKIPGMGGDPSCHQNSVRITSQQQRGENQRSPTQDSPGSNSSSISVLQHESESLISPRNFAALSRGNASTICSCLAALVKYDLRSRQFFMTKKAKSGTTIRSRDSARYSLPETSHILR